MWQWRGNAGAQREVSYAKVERATGLASNEENEEDYDDDELHEDHDDEEVNEVEDLKTLT